MHQPALDSVASGAEVGPDLAAALDTVGAKPDRADDAFESASPRRCVACPEARTATDSRGVNSSEHRPAPKWLDFA
jgi:hypothetical protein